MSSTPTNSGAEAPTAAVVVCTYNHAHFLADALDSVCAQSRPPDEIVVVDDGSIDDPETVVARYPGVRLVRQENRGLAAARNIGLVSVSSRFVVFLDADDVLMPGAIEAGLACIAAHPGAGFVYGGYLRVDHRLAEISGPHFEPLGGQAFQELLRRNRIGMHATVLYDREKLAACGGFDASNRRCEDYDVYLRMAQLHPVAFHAGTVAAYRQHGSNMSGNEVEMLQWALRVHARHKPARTDDAAHRAWREGRRNWKLVYEKAWRGLREQPRLRAMQGALQLARLAPKAVGVNLLSSAAGTVLPGKLKYRLKRWLGRPVSPPVGKVKLGDLAQRWPISMDFGFDRGQPIDRFYIEQFLARHRQDITGRVLEVGDASYSRQFGHGIARQDVIHVTAGNPQATIVGELSRPSTLPRAAFDCIVMTQTLQFIYDMAAAVREVHEGLRPGGMVLATMPGISPIDRGEWADRWCWSLTSVSAHRLFADVFGAKNVEVGVNGNFYAATCFLAGLAAEEVRQEWLSDLDPAFPVVITVRARRAAE